ncbi:hypothetical protein SAMN05920897_10744 [Alkalispirochaeta americana]|uniref:Dolichyl-phosphate-mannose-protein mannosyltransferase n=2 Tax=Alkalispirochaeta americana TaxID=159291 RepID=A0A1N6RX18_9SPIO|nr:hypothetical protein SAMN05920897_10744 [Alkalispirochaeta americana]
MNTPGAVDSLALVAAVAATLLGVAYLGLHLWSLPWFPFVHSDEAWLASLSRTIWLEKNLAATEEFFLLTPRHPHAIKTLYHLIQGPLVSRWWTIGAARAPSLAGGLITVALLGLVLRREKIFPPVAVALTLAFALDPLLFAASHLARQEALLLAALAGGIAAGSALVAGIILGLAVFIHPNSFVAAAAVLPWVVYRSRPGRMVRDLAIYLGMLALAGTLALALSLFWDPQFFSNYLAFGRSVGVTAHPLVRLREAVNFIIKMSQRIAGTYYLPPSLIQLAALGIATPLALALSAWRGIPGKSRRLLRTCAFSSLFTAAALVIIGKYSPPSTVFLLPGLYYTLGALAGAVAKGWPRRGVRLLLTGLGLGLAGITGTLVTTELIEMFPARVVPEDHGRGADVRGLDSDSTCTYTYTYTYTYTEYLARINSSVPPGAPVLASLNSAFAFEPGQLRVFRDLESLDPLEGSLERFLLEQRVEWVVIPREELALVYRERPLWNQVYGNPHRFYRELEELLERRGQVQDSFLAPWYGARLIPLASRIDPRVVIYRLVPPEESLPDRNLIPPEGPGSDGPGPGGGPREGVPPGGS